MEKGYKVSRELGRAKPTIDEEVTLTEAEIDSILDITPNVENVTVDARFYWLNGFTGTAKQGIVIQSDFVSQIRKLEEATGKNAVGFCIMDDNTVQIMLEE